MDPTTVTAIIGIVLHAVQAAVKAGKSIREALADSLEEAAAKIRAGAINVDEAIERARQDQTKIDGLRKRATPRLPKPR